MTEHEASRTLVKSTPELWAECSDSASLARHFGAFGEIRITKLEPETAVAWEGEEVRGTVTLEPAGWGTRVILTAVAEPGDEFISATSPTLASPPASPLSASEPAGGLEPVKDVEQAAADAAEPAVVDPAEAAPEGHPGFFRRLFGGWRRAAPAVARGAASTLAPTSVPGDEELLREPEEAVAPRALIPSQASPRAERAQTLAEPAAAALREALDSLGRAHHRPYSRG